MKPRPWDKTHPENFFKKSDIDGLAVIENRILKIESFLQEKFGLDFQAFCAEFHKPAEAAKRRGPKPCISDDHLFINRDRYIDFLENHWPELQPIFKNSKRNPAAAKEVLERIGDPRNGAQAPTARKLLRVFDSLVEFLNSKEYNGDPRQLANAMAGVPAISWSTSQKRCRSHPSEMAIGERALLDYLKRNFRRVYVQVVNAKTPEHRQQIMQGVSTDDREYKWLRENPEVLTRAIMLREPRDIIGDPERCRAALNADEPLSPTLL